MTKSSKMPAEQLHPALTTHQLVQLLDGSPLLIYVKDTEHRFTFANSALCNRLGRTRSEVLGRTTDELLPPVAADEHRADDLRVVATRRPLETEEEIPQSDGVHTYLTMKYPLVDRSGSIEAVAGVSTDITERKESEEALRRSSRALRAFGGVNQALVRAQSQEELLSTVCHTIVEDAGYALAWVGFIEHDEAKSVVPVEHCGKDEGYVRGLRLSWGDGPAGSGPFGRSIRELSPIVVRDVDTEVDFIWRDEALARGFRSMMCLPLTGPGEKALGALCIYSLDGEAFDAEEVALLTELAEDLSYGLETLKARGRRADVEDRLLRTNERLEGMLKDIVATMGKVVEARDPYTQGHETAVARLSRLLAAEMGLPDTEIDGIEIAALVHDIGKLAVPAEILTKPGRLTDTEFSLIMEHPRQGYEILKNIDFGWPVADIALQHHERMDGSGYPNHLSGTDILLAARIVAVADVVEAMAAHRPYRAALGLDVAVAEIADNPEKYDSRVVAACVRLYREGRIDFAAGGSDELNGG